MKAQIVIFAALLALAGCSQSKEASVDRSMVEDQAKPVSNEKPERIVKSGPQSGWDKEMQRAREDSPPRRAWGGK